MSNPPRRIPDFSSSEQLMPYKWIDGKEVYRSVISASIQSNGAGNTSIPLIASKILYIDGTVTANGTTFLQFNYLLYPITRNYVYFSGNKIMVDYVSDNGASADYIITVEYIKQ